MKEANTKRKLVWAFLPFISPEEVDRTNETIRSFRKSFSITDDDYKRVTELHNFVFRRLLQIDPMLRRKRKTEQGVPAQQFFSTLDRPRSKAESKGHLATAHRLLDKYAVPASERRQFFKALMTAWYYVRIAAMGDLELERIKTFQ